MFRVNFMQSCNSSGNRPNPLNTINGPNAFECNSGTNFSYYRARYYDSGTGRFISEDPIGLDGEGVNFYRYVADSPINRTDPSGLRSAAGHGKVINHSKCCALVSSNDKNPAQQDQHYILPGQDSGDEDVDAIYYPDGHVLKIRDGVTVTFSKCPGDNGHWPHRTLPTISGFPFNLLNRRFGSLAEATSVFGKIVPPAGGDIPAQCRKSCGK